MRQHERVWKNLAMQKAEADSGHSSLSLPAVDESEVNGFAEALRNPTIKLEPDEYTSRTTGLKGFKAMFWLNGQCYRYTVSNTEFEVSPVEVANAITSPASSVTRPGRPYKEGRGWEATVTNGEHSYMLNRCRP